jgi:hypothetical protein
MSRRPARPSLMTYFFRRLRMYTPLLEQNARITMRERQLKAEVDNRARRLRTVRRWQRKAEKANLQLRLARLAVR